MKSYTIKYGIIGGITLTISGLLNWFLLAPYAGVAITQAIGYLGIVLGLLCIPFGIKYFRDQINNGSLSFGQGFKAGMSITLITSIMMFFYGLLFYIWQGDKFQEWTLKGLEGEKLEKMQAQLDVMPDYAMTPWFQGIILFMIIFSIGLVMTLVGSFTLKRAGTS